MTVNIHSVMSKSKDLFVLNLTCDEAFTDESLIDILEQLANKIRNQNEAVPQPDNRTDSELSNGEPNSAGDRITQEFVDASSDLIRSGAV